MTYRDAQRLADIQAAIDAIHSHLQRGDLTDGLVFDAVRIRLLEIGEAAARRRSAIKAAPAPGLVPVTAGARAAADLVLVAQTATDLGAVAASVEDAVLTG